MTSGEEQAEAEMLALSIERGDTTTVESAIASDSFDVEARLPRSTPLVLAAECGRAEIVKLLLSASAQIDSTDDRRMTACHHAALRGFVFVLAALLEHRPNLALMDDEQRTSLQCSFARSNGERSSTMLIVAGAPLDSVPDHRLCSFAASSVTAVHALIGRGVAVRNLHDGHMSTPLHMAAAMGGRDPAVLKRLVDVFGADLSARDCWGATCTFILHSVPMPMLFASSSPLAPILTLATRPIARHCTLRTDMNALCCCLLPEQM
jgi:hypothetical protein